MNSIVKMSLMFCFIVCQTMHAGEAKRPLMKSNPSGAIYGSIVPAANASDVVDMKKLNEINLKLDAFHQDVKEVRLAVAALGKEIAALELKQRNN